ncbi:molybdenum cofactor sulfurase [Ophiocordyceps sinensis CO18]|uniref:Molybdenum cofactor sulfurase n=1 Tax=Ophiocordyceps sinensis (strain Co18 / CGMCC 3.14243) TaxID=911162 RepID=T5ANV9_OPHSC|nr:molybdenum cofactor sulfurase [Ophiocordyceps sinensis CO18]
MASHVEAAYHAGVEDLRDLEYPMLKDGVYLDHAASTPCSKSLMDAFAAEMTSTLYGNPHSASWPSQLSAARIDDVRLSLLSFVKANPAEYDLVFVANATAGVKLIVEAMRSLPQGYVYAYHQACHTSLVGAREDAHFSTCLDDNGVQSWLNGADPFGTAPQAPSARLFSFSAQSHMDGQRYPLSWPKDLQDRAKTDSPRLYTLLDAASLGATSQLDLGSPDFAADFVVLSLYKIFGYPELGVLMIRRSAEPVFDNRRYFGGGTVDMVTCGKERWHARKTQSLHERLEDGTLPFQNIMAVDVALRVHKTLFGSMNNVAAHTSYLAIKLRDRLGSLRHGNGRPVCVMYADATKGRAGQGSGPVVSFNIVNAAGGWVSLAEFEKLAILRRMHVRTGGLCCPGGIASTLGLEPWELKGNLSAGYRCGMESDIATGKPHGVIRASLGAMSIASDVDSFADFVREFFVEDKPTAADVNLATSTRARNSCTLRVKTITVYPIKSCGGFAIPPGICWGVRAEGLAWDREWCLVHRGSGQALSQKRYPNMALLRPVLNLECGIMRVVFHGPSQESWHPYVEIPLSANPDVFRDGSHQLPSRVCGEQVYAQVYASSELNDFFTNVLGVPCVLARFPPGGHGLGSRTCKARLQKHQRVAMLQNIPGSFPDVPSPPDSDSEQQHTKILLSNESPILLIHSSSVDALNYEISSRGGDAVAESTFRANMVVESLARGPGEPAYSEDTWTRIRIGDVDFKMLGACRRCQMVCVDQVTAERGQEPLTTLAKTRRFDSKVYFGSHMRHEPGNGWHCPSSPPPTIEVGDLVLVYDGQCE